MTTSEFDTLNKMIDKYSKTCKFDSVTELLSEITDQIVLEFISILPKYRTSEEIISKLQYIRDNVVERDCLTCVENEKIATEKENKTMNELNRYEE